MANSNTIFTELHLAHTGSLYCNSFMQCKFINIIVVLCHSFLLTFSQTHGPVAIPAAMYYKIKPHNTLTRQELLQSGLVDTADILPSVSDATFDTTVSLSHSISWLIICLNDSAGNCLNYFLATININTQSRLFYRHLYAVCDIDITTSFFKVNSYKILSEDHILCMSVTKHRLVQRQNFDEKTGDALKSVSNKKTSLWIKPDGEIIESRKAPK